MIWQIKYLLGVGEGGLSHIMEQKLDRQIERIKNEYKGDWNSGQSEDASVPFTKWIT